MMASHELQPALRARDSHLLLRHCDSCGLFRPFSRSSQITSRPGTNKQAASVGQAHDTSLKNELCANVSKSHLFRTSGSWHNQSCEDLKGGRRGSKRESLKMNLTHYFYPKASAFLQEAFQS